MPAQCLPESARWTKRWRDGGMAGWRERCARDGGCRYIWRTAPGSTRCLDLCVRYGSYSRRDQLVVSASNLDLSNVAIVPSGESCRDQSDVSTPGCNCTSYNSGNMQILLLIHNESAYRMHTPSLLACTRPLGCTVGTFEGIQQLKEELLGAGYSGWICRRAIVVDIY